MRFALALLAVACTAPTPAKTPDQLFPRSSHRIARVPRPAIVVPAIDRESLEIDRGDLIWPLRREPMLEPHAPIARLYGVESWRSLCEVRRDPRGVEIDEAVEYLIAWCELQPTRLSQIRNQLGALVRTRSPAIAIGARDDIVELLALEPLPAAYAMDWLRGASLTDSRMLDLLSAAYVATDRIEDARVVTAELARGPAWVSGMDCRSLLRIWWLLDKDWVRDGIRQRSDPTCKRIAGTLVRIDTARTCPLLDGADPLHDDPCTELGCGALGSQLARCGELGATPRAKLAYAYRHWPSLEGRPWVWLAYARYVGGDSDEARAIAAAALENAALTSDCGEILPAIREFAATLGDGPPQAYLREIDYKTCVKRHSPTLDHHR